jgi:hypothetical protein
VPKRDALDPNVNVCAILEDHCDWDQQDLKNKRAELDRIKALDALDAIREGKSGRKVDGSPVNPPGPPPRLPPIVRSVR